MKQLENTVTVACLGDSITRGRASYNWFRQISKELKRDGYCFKNFGIDGDTAFHALQRVDSVIESDPDFIFILLGTNDVITIIRGVGAKKMIKRAPLPQKPTIAWYAENLEEIIVKLKEAVSAKIVLITLPVLGDDLAHSANKLVNDFNVEIKKISRKFELDVLDLNEKMSKFLDENPPKHPVGFRADTKLMYNAVNRRYLLFQSWNRISRAHGLLLTTDTIHHNRTSGEMLGGLVKTYLANNQFEKLS